jgi:hypothetical protein
MPAGVEPPAARVPRWAKAFAAQYQPPSASAAGDGSPGNLTRGLDVTLHGPIPRTTTFANVKAREAIVPANDCYGLRVPRASKCKG